MLPQFSRSQAVVIGFLIVLLSIGLLFPDLVPWKTAKANLRVDLLVEHLDEVTGDYTPFAEYLVKSSHLGCLPEMRTEKDPGWQDWCGRSAVNLPIQTDENGRATLWFLVEPSPEDLGVIPSWIWVTVNFDLGERWIKGSGKKEIITPNHWSISVALPRSAPSHN